MKEKIVISWSGGKDAALCLNHIRQSAQYDILCLLTTINAAQQRISMHGVRVELLRAQAKSLGLPLVELPLPEMPSMEDYEREMAAVLKNLKSKGASAVAFGDIFLEDIRQYREQKLDELQLNALFPLWNIPTDRLIRTFLILDFKAIVTCVHEKYLDKNFTGRMIDTQFLNDLPDGVDVCGEHGEYHTFVFDGPIFQKPIPFRKGEVVYRTYNAPNQQAHASPRNNDEHGHAHDPFGSGFWYCDLLPPTISETPQPGWK